MITQDVITKFDEAVSRGFCSGVGSQDGQMCVEAAVCYAMGLPHGDEPECVEPAVRSYKITLNDSKWSSPQARAAGLRDLGIAQIGSKGVVDGVEFARIMARKTIQVLIPALFCEVLAHDEACMTAAKRCETEGTAYAARAACAARAAAYAARAAAYAARAACATDAAYAAAYAARAARAACAADAAADKYLLLSASLALETLRELGSPGCAWLESK